MDRFIEVEQYRNKWQGSGSMKIDPTQVSYIEYVTPDGWSEKVGHSKIHTIFGGIIEADETPDMIADKINDWYDERDKENKDSITISKDDLVKNFLLRTLSNNQRQYQ